MSRLLEKFMDFFGFAEFEEESESVISGKPAPREEKAGETVRLADTGKGSVVTLPGGRQHRVVVVEPREFEETQQIARYLKERCEVIINLENTDKETAQRIIDFACGACYALDGRAQKVSPGVFLFVPFNVHITSELKSDAGETGFLPWLSAERFLRMRRDT